MRTRPSPRALALLAAAAALAVGAAGGRAQEQPAQSVDEAGWQGVLGVRDAVSTAQRYVVLLRPPSLAARVRAAGGRVSETQMRAWSASAVAQQEQFLARLSAVGARIAAEYRYTRVVNGFSARLDPTSAALLDDDREVIGIYPVRIAYPAQAAQSDGGVLPSAVADLEIAGLDGSGVTVALLDTGVDPSHPYLRRRVLSGVDVINPGSGGIAQPHPTIPGRPERHGTELAGIIAGTEGPDGLHGIAPGASILPVRVGGWQPNSEGGYSIYSRTDQLLAGLEAAVDPNGDGDVLDAARIALIGMVEPYAAFADGPLPRGIAGAADLDLLTIVPAGNDGRAGPGYGSIAGPGGAADAVTVGAADGRLAAPTVRVHVRAGLRVLYEEDIPLGGAPTETVTAGVAVVDRRTASRGLRALFAEDGVSTVAGQAVLLPRSALSDDTVEEATSAGALSVLVDGPLPAGAFSLDVPAGVPVVGLASDVVAEIRAMLAAGVPVTVAIGNVKVASREAEGSIAAFSSRGLVLDGSLKPDLAAPGVSVPTSEPGRGDDGQVRFGTISGTSAAAAVTAGVAALVAQGRPGLGARQLHGVLVGSASRADLDPTASGAGLVDLRAAVQQELIAEPALLSFGAVAGPVGAERTIRITNVSTRRISVSVGVSAIAPKGVEIEIDPQRFRLRPGRGATVVVRASTTALSAAAGAATGEVVLRGSDTPEVHVPWTVAVPQTVDLVSRIRLKKTGNRVSDATPAALSFVAGSVTAAPDPQVRAIELLEVELRRNDELLGVLARRRELLPGRYTFGLTGRGATGTRLGRGPFRIRLVAYPGDGTRRQTDAIVYRPR
ncbi:MAG: GlyGly-CTERM sorting protein [Gaiellaceae bacterium]|jgi:subtilisin family serine protease|nr:GlyGly-CTERM sorting protein [Gaiellaceae bacterium]